MLEQFNDEARQAVTLAQEQARRLHHTSIGTEHLLLGLVQVSGGAASRALEACGVPAEVVRARIEEVVVPGSGEPPDHMPFTPRAKQALEAAPGDAQSLGGEQVGAEHLLLGIAEGQGIAARVLQQLGAGGDVVRRALLTPPAQPAWTPVPPPPGWATVAPGAWTSAPLATPGDAFAQPPVAPPGPPPVTAPEAPIAGAATPAVAPPIPALVAPPAAAPVTAVPAPSLPVGSVVGSSQVGEARCGFCGRRESRVTGFVTGWDACICNDCVALARAALADSRNGARRHRIRPRFAGPADAQAAETSIEQAADALLGPDVHVDHVRFLGPDEAELRVTASLYPGRVSAAGHAVLVNGRWTVTSETARRLAGGLPADR